MGERFVHCHLHTDRSFLDGVGRSNEYAELAAEAGHPALAITDHGNLYGLPEHRRACKKVGIAPIFGCELYTNDDRANSTGKRLTKEEKVAMDPTFIDTHLVAIAMTDEGWKNLLRINHDSVLNGYHYQARTDTDFVLRHSKGLIVTTACLGSQFGRYAASGDVAKLRALLGKYKDALGDRFYCEIHINELEQQRRVNAVLLREVSQLKIPTILTSDVHYACAGDARLQDEMIAVSRRVPVDDPNAFKVEARHLYYSGVEAAVRLNRDTKCGVPERLIREAAENTVLLASRCTADIYPRDGVLRPPRYINPQGIESTDPFGDLRAAVVEGFAKRVAPYTPKGQRHVYAERLKHEMSVIKKCGMSDFYLVTADIAREAEDRDIFLWTRGSGCASLVAAAIGITRVDPVRFGLLFERFVDPSRANAPDFDLDIDSTRREELIEWFSAKYGGNNRERIARISSLSTFGLKSAIRDVCEMSRADMQAAFRISAVTDSLPPSVELSLAEAAPSERLAAFKSAEEEISKLAKPEDVQTFFVKHRQAAMDSLAMVGRVRGRTQHAAGYVVAPGPLVDYLPIDKIGSGDASAYVSAWGEGQAMQDIGETGLMKIDFLGLEACAIIAEAARVIAENTKRTITQVFAELNGLAMDFSDPDVLREYAMGDGVGLHQLATQDRSLAKIVARLKPRSVADIAAAVSLYRPGSIAHVESFIDRARGKEAVPAVHPIVDEILRDTFGVMVYQEQVMKLINQIGGMPLRKAYEIIKFISKKNLAKIKAAREDFIKGAILSKLDTIDANRIFDDVESSAGYSFNACVSGGERLWIADGTRYTVEEAYQKFRSRSPIGKKMRDGRWRVLQMDDDGRVRPGFVKDVVYNGIVETIRVKTPHGTVRVTKNHRLLTPSGYRLAGDLVVGDSLIAVDTVKVPQRRDTGKRVGLKGYRGCGFPTGEENPSWIDGKTVYLNQAKQIVLDRSHGMCERCGSGSGRLEFAHTQSLEMLGGVTQKYHSHQNLRLLCNPCHKKLDYLKGERVPAWSKGLPTIESKITSIGGNRIERVYDLVMDTQGHNFVLNGIISHNSHGTSYAILSWITAYLRSKYPTEFWCALLNRTDNKAAEKNKKQTERKIEVVMKAASKAGIKLLPPTLAGSGGLWSITGPKTLLAPLSIIPGVGYEAAERIKAAWQREKWPRIMSFFAWADTNRKSANAKAIVGMACAGALCKAFPNQTINPSAARDLATYFAGSKKKSKLRDLEFAIKTDRASVLRTRNDPEIAISIERAGLGFNFWRSPWTLNDRLGKIDRMRDAGKIPALGERSVNGKRWPFMLQGIHLHADRRGKIMAFLTLAEPEGESVKGVCFSSIWPDDPPKVGGVYLVSGSYDRKKGDFMVEKSGTSHGPFRDMDLIDF